MKIQFTWTADTPPTSVVLSDPTGSFGVIRNNLFVVVPSGTPMEDLGSGSYEYNFEDNDFEDAADYSAWVSIVVGKLTVRVHKYLKKAASVEFSEQTIDSPANVLLEVLCQLGAVSDASTISLHDRTTKRNWLAGITLQETPDEFVALYDSGGVINSVLQSRSRKVIVEHSDVQLRVRSKPGDLFTAQKKAKALKELLTNTRNYDVSVSSEIPNELPILYRLCVATPLSKEAFIGLDSKGRPSYTVNMRTNIKQVSN